MYGELNFFSSIPMGQKCGLCRFSTAPSLTSVTHKVQGVCIWLSLFIFPLHYFSFYSGAPVWVRRGSVDMICSKRTNLLGEAAELHHLLRRSVHFSVQLSSLGTSLLLYQPTTWVFYSQQSARPTWNGCSTWAISVDYQLQGKFCMSPFGKHTAAPVLTRFHMNLKWARLCTIYNSCFF